MSIPVAGFGRSCVVFCGFFFFPFFSREERGKKRAEQQGREEKKKTHGRNEERSEGMGIHRTAQGIVPDECTGS